MSDEGLLGGMEGDGFLKKSRHDMNKVVLPQETEIENLAQLSHEI